MNRLWVFLLLLLLLNTICLMFITVITWCMNCWDSIHVMYQLSVYRCYMRYFGITYHASTFFNYLYHGSDSFCTIIGILKKYIHMSSMHDAKGTCPFEIPDIIRIFCGNMCCQIMLFYSSWILCWFICLKVVPNTTGR